MKHQLADDLFTRAVLWLSLDESSEFFLRCGHRRASMSHSVSPNLLCRSPTPSGCMLWRIRSRLRCLWGVAVALDDLAERGGEVAAGGFEVRVHIERTAEEVRGLAVFTERHVAEALAGERAEVMGLAGQKLLAIGHGGRGVAAEVAGGGALVPALGEVRRAADDVGEEGLGREQVAALHRLDAALEDLVDLGRARGVPHLPQR